jgi:hypothetical protein
MIILVMKKMGKTKCEKSNYQVETNKKMSTSSTMSLKSSLPQSKCLMNALKMSFRKSQ